MCFSIIYINIFAFQRKIVSLPKIFKTYDFKAMKFNDRIKQIRENKQIPQRKLAAAMDIDTASYCKIEKGERRARKEHIPIIAELLQTNEKELLDLWFADQIYSVVKDAENADEVLSMVAENIIEYERRK